MVSPVIVAAVFKFSTSRLGQIVVNDPGVACGTPSETEAEQCGTRTNDPAIKYDESGSQTTAPYKYALEVQVTDNGSPTALSCTATVTVIVTDVNEKPYFVDPANVATRVTSYTTTLAENNKGPTETPIWQFAVKAQDAETPGSQSVSYTLEALSELSPRYTCANPGPTGKSSACDVKFKIDTTGTSGIDGIITMVDSNPDALDKESLSQIYLEVTVTDNHASKQSSTARVTISVTDVNEPPVIPTSILSLSVREDAITTAEVLPLPLVTEASALNDRLGADVDDPSTTAGTVGYSWTSSTGTAAATQFTLDLTTQIITVASTLNFETKSSGQTSRFI